MLAELGIQFSVKGMDDVQRRLKSLEQSVGGLSRSVDRDVRSASGHFDKFSHSANKMATSVQTAMNTAKLAIGGFLAGKTIGGFAEWVKSNPEADAWKDYLRRNEASADALKEYGQHLKGLRGRMPGVADSDYYQGMMDIQSKFGTGAVEANKKGIESAIGLAKGLGPGSSIAQSSDLLRKFMWSYGTGKSNDELQGMVERFSAQIPKAVTMSGARGHDFQVSLGHVVALYSQLGRSQEDMIADIATVAGALGERSGELLRAVMSKEGTGFGKLAAAVANERELIRMGAKTEFDLPKEVREQHKANMEVTKANAARWGGLAASRDPAMLMIKINEFLAELQVYAKKRGLDVGNIIQESYGEAGMQGLPLMTKAYSSGQRQELGKALKEVSPAEEMEKTEKSFQSFSARYEIFKQKIEDLSKEMKKPFQAVAMEMMKPYGDAIDRIQQNWAQKSDAMAQNARGFWASFGGGFSGAFEGAAGLQGILDRLIDTLGSPDVNKWQSLGDEFGRLAGMNLKGTTESIGKLAEALPPIAKLMGQIASAAEKIDKVGTWFGGVREEYAPTWLGGKPRERSLILDQEPVVPPYLSLGEDVAQSPQTVPRAARPPSIMERTINERLSAVGMQPPTVNVETKPQINVTIGDREIKEIAVEAYKEEAKADYAAGRRGFGESWGY